MPDSPHLGPLNWEPMELDHVPLHVAILTMELAALKPRLAALETALERLARTGSTATGVGTCQSHATKVTAST